LVLSVDESILDDSMALRHEGTKSFTRTRQPNDRRGK
jgi:hypothetical protein